jgi:hypothetical protein
MIRVLSGGMLALALTGTLSTDAAAQDGPPASQKGTVSQTINTTVVTVEYQRPSARGRLLFGDTALVKYDALWTPGANRATILELSRDARVAGRALPAGRYSVWLIPRAGEWTLTINRKWDAHHAIYPGEEEDVFRTRVRPQTAPMHMETLAIYFPQVGPYEAPLHIHWGSTLLAIVIEVER